VTNPKGTAWETAVVNWLGARGLLARRIVRHGSKDEGDIELSDVPGVVIEAKNSKGLSLAEWVDEAVAEAANHAVPVGVVWHRRRKSPKLQDTSPGNGYVTMSGDHFARQLEELRALRARVAELEAALRARSDDLEWQRFH
jgi:hypothetical protein